MECLTNLEKLDLRFYLIEEISGLEYLRNLKELNLDGNPIREDESHLVGKNAQEVVRYCHEKIGQKALDRWVLY